MSRWARWTTKPNTGLSLSKFMTEREQSAAAIEAQRQGLEFAGFAKYRDPKTGQIVARVVGDELIPVEGDQPGGFGTTGATTDTGNPTGAGYMGPADRARQMGLQSDGSGGYIDPSTGQVVARTVNNELVFYSPQGGAVSDGAGGEQLTQASPSWVDPVTGELMVPPAQPESPEEKMAVPAPVPALAPASYNMFMNFKRKQMYKQNAEQTAAQQEIDGQQQEQDAQYAKNEGLDQMYQFLQGAIEDALESSDPDRVGAANAMQDLLASPEVQEDLFLLFDAAGPNGREELDAKVVDYIIKQARSNHLVSDMGNPEDYTGKDGFQYGEEGYDRELEKRGGTPGMGMQGEPNRYNLRNYDGVMDDFRSQIGMRDIKYKPVAQMLQDAVASAEERKGRNAAANAEIEVDRMNDPDFNGEVQDRGFDASEFYDDNNDIEVDGEHVIYRLSDSGKPDQDFIQKNIIDKGLMNNAEHRFSPRLQKLNNFNGPQGAVTIDWDVKGDIDENDPKMKKRVALDALTTWRQKILPNLDPGTVVHNTPADEQRARIYTLAGFSDPNKTNDQFGLVIMDRDGQKKVVPLGPRTTRVTKMEESYLAMAGLDLNTDEMELVYEVLLG